MEEIVIPWQPIVLMVVLMVLDIISGFAGAAKSGVVESGKMREGLWHKAGFIGLVILAIVWEIAVVWINFDAAAKGAGIIIPVMPAVSGVCALIAIIELISIIENLCVLNPQIAQLPFVKKLKVHEPDAPYFSFEVDEHVPDEKGGTPDEA